MVKDSHLLVGFAVFATAAFGYTWRVVSKPAPQISAAVQGVPGTEPISAFMATLLMVWVLLLITVIYLGRHR